MSRDHSLVREGSSWSRHRRWLLPLVFGVILVLVAVWEMSNRGSEGELLAAFYSRLAIAAAVVLLAIAAARGRAAYGTFRRQRGRLTSSERAAAVREETWQNAWRDAVALRSRLLAQELPPTLALWDVVARSNEEFFCDVPAGYARYYGMTVEYPQSAGFFYGRPAFVLGGLAATAIGNRASRVRAETLAKEQWREHAPCRLVVTNQRLLVHAAGRWLSFDYATMTAVYPEPTQGALVCEFGGAEPLLLTGMHAPFAAVMTVFRTHGALALREHPALVPLT